MSIFENNKWLESTNSIAHTRLDKNYNDIPSGTTITRTKDIDQITNLRRKLQKEGRFHKVQFTDGIFEIIVYPKSSNIADFISNVVAGSTLIKAQEILNNLEDYITNSDEIEKIDVSGELMNGEE